ncbi:unnamed protein product [Thelazia callipaeda]|uniref:Carbonic anhydrase n=1 Tax=Thelazia callipaeda TaxID=103827 RepID=A0A0N5CN77_THECL|nr:unnamed protein product [Thelazia callipaeda]
MITLYVLDETEKFGQKQSPINISLGITDFDSKLKASKLKFAYTIGDLKTIEKTKNGFSCKTGGECTSELSGSHLPGRYKLWEVHGHWGTEKNSGSEHLLNGKGFSAELHFVFRKMKYGKFDNCFDKRDGLTVLALFMEEDSNDNTDFSPVISGLRKLVKNSNHADLDKEFDLQNLLPKKLSYYSYEGSLTSKPFAECVIWTILKHRITIGTDQLAFLREIIPNNCRSLQPLNKRRVKRSFKLVKKSSSKDNN